MITGGEVLYYPEPGRPVDLLSLDEAELRGLRWSQIAVVLQSAMNALNPVLTIGSQLTDVLQAHEPDMDSAARRARAAELLSMVGITADRLGSYPFELSGGMRQRVMIAMALALEPQIVILDEPTTALDVVTQREILEELTALRERLGFAVLFITHDLSLLVEIADAIAVMYAGRLVERAARRRAVPLAPAPLHPRPAELLPRAARPAPVHDRHSRVAPGPADAAGRLRVPPALPVRHGPLPGAVPAAGAARGGSAAPGGAPRSPRGSPARRNPPPAGPASPPSGPTAAAGSSPAGCRTAPRSRPPSWPSPRQGRPAAAGRAAASRSGRAGRTIPHSRRASPYRTPGASHDPARRRDPRSRHRQPAARGPRADQALPGPPRLPEGPGPAEQAAPGQRAGRASGGARGGGRVAVPPGIRDHRGRRGERLRQVHPGPAAGPADHPDVRPAVPRRDRRPPPPATAGGSTPAMCSSCCRTRSPR